MDDPRKVLAEAEVECAELDDLFVLLESLTEDEYLTFTTNVALHAALLALARLVVATDVERRLAVLGRIENHKTARAYRWKLEFIALLDYQIVLEADRAWEEKQCNS